MSSRASILAELAAPAIRWCGGPVVRWLMGPLPGRAGGPLPLTEQRACRSCGAPVYWLRHDATAQLAPIDVGATPLGDCILDLEAGTYRKRAGVTGQHLNHFATCPQSSAWRRR